MRMLNKISTTALILVLMLQLAGCGSFLDSLASQGITRFLDTVLGELIQSGGKADLNSYSDRRYDMSNVLDQQKELYQMMFNGVMFEIHEPDVYNNRDEGKCKVTFRNVPDVASTGLEKGTLDDYKAALRKSDKTRVNVVFNVVRDSDGDWIFADLDDFYREFLEPFGQFCFLDEDNNPLNITAEYVRSVVVDSVWYDPEMGNPLEGLFIKEPVTLINVFYFEQPVTLELTAKLFRDNREIREMEVKVDNGTTAMFDFYGGGGENAGTMQPGKYHVELYYDGEKIEGSDVLTVK